jgi:hypothetical protein
MKKLILTLAFVALATLAYAAFAKAPATSPRGEPLPLQATPVGYHYRYHHRWHRSWHWHRAAVDAASQYTPARAQLI